MPGNPESIEITNYVREYYAKFGKNILRMRSASASGTETGVYQSTEVLPVGQYTFSAYIRVTSAFSGGSAPGAYIRVSAADGAVLAESEHIAKSDSEYVRLIAPFELTAAQSVQVQFLMNGKGIVCADAAQLEKNPYANAYNMLENGNFELDGGWSLPSGVSYTNETCFNMSRSLMMAGNLEYNRLAYQDVTVRTARATRETFTLSGWAKAWGLPDHERDGAIAPTFRLRAVVKYYDTYYREYGTEEYAAEFSPCTEEWQFASVQFAKSKYRMVEYVRVYCEYGHNSGCAYFDDIQLIRDSIETSLSASDFATESADGSDADSEAAETTDTTPIFDEVKDPYGNALTETTFTDGEFGTVYRAFEFNTDDGTGNAGNDLISETDARGNKTGYTVDEDTSRREEVTDRLGNKTAYEYDASGRTAKVTSKDAAGTELADVSYAYDALDNMTEIVRGDGMKYVLAYNAFHNLESIGVSGRGDKLINYTYKNGNGRLKEIAYANGDKMKAAYNSIGQMVAEKWFDRNDTLTAYYKYVYDGQGNIVRSIDMAGGKEYTYDYEEEKLVRSSEYDIILSEEIVVSKTAANTVKYYYDSQGKLTKKRIIPEIGTEQVIYCENPENENAVVKFTAGGRTVTSHSKTDSFGRKVFDELQLGTGFVSRQFHYHAGEITEEHKDNAKLKSSATTQLVSQIVLSGGRAVSYEYDKEERITKVTDSVLGTTEYTYDALGQLLTETADGTVVNTVTYDNYGNIVTKNGIEYTYGDSNWKDLLTKVGDQTISYDAQGNPTSYLGHTLAWEKGRQLKSFDDTTYTYNASGIRTSKTVNGIKHTYTLDGTKILRETWGDNTLIPMYDNEDSVCGIIFNNHPFYFHRNLQGDIIAILDKDAETVAAYSYDAWGACTIIADSSNCAIASLNPFRYRGYYFDSEIEMYYLQSRYYDPKVGRFVNADETMYLGINGDAPSYYLESNLSYIVKRSYNEKTLFTYYNYFNCIIYDSNDIT